MCGQGVTKRLPTVVNFVPRVTTIPVNSATTWTTQPAALIGAGVSARPELATLLCEPRMRGVYPCGCIVYPPAGVSTCVTGCVCARGRARSCACDEWCSEVQQFVFRSRRLVRTQHRHAHTTLLAVGATAEPNSNCRRAAFLARCGRPSHWFCEQAGLGQRGQVGRGPCRRECRTPPDPLPPLPLQPRPRPSPTSPELAQARSPARQRGVAAPRTAPQLQLCPESPAHQTGHRQRTHQTRPPASAAWRRRDLAASARSAGAAAGGTLACGTASGAWSTECGRPGRKEQGRF